MPRTTIAVFLGLTLVSTTFAQSSRRNTVAVGDLSSTKTESTGQGSTGQGLEQVDFTQQISSGALLDSVQPVGQPCGSENPNCDDSRIDFRSFMPISRTRSDCDVGRPCFQNYFGSISSVFLSREAGDFQVSYDVGGGNTRTASLNHGFNAGLEATLAMRTGPTGRFEVTYLGVNDWSSDNRADFVPLGGGPSRLSSFDTYTANLNDLQFNLVAMDPYANWDWLFGFRIIDQRDEAESLLTVDDGLGGPNSVFTERVFAEAANTLYGFQAGTRYGRSFGLLTFDSGAKLGLFHNSTSQDGSLFVGGVTIDGIPEATLSTDGGEVSVMGDFHSRLSYRVTASSEMHIGYRALVFSDIVQSAERDGQSADASGLGYHGVTCGITIYR
ncbi:MAG: hypothetical protein AAF802_09730 [Planctomycetota bacterium]